MFDRHLKRRTQNMMGKLTRKNGVPLFCNILHFWRIWLSLTSSKYLRAPSSIYVFCLKISCSPSSSAFFLARDLLISVFVSLHMDSLDLLSILCLHSFLDCLPSVVRKFWSPPLIAWKYVKTRLLVKSLSAIGDGKVCSFLKFECGLWLFPIVCQFPTWSCYYCKSGHPLNT